MNQYFLKFADKAEALTLGAISAEMAEGEIVKSTANYFIDAVGVISKTVTVPAILDEFGGVISEETTSTVEQVGYHVNLLIDELPSELLPYTVTVLTPYRIFAGY